MYTALLDAQDGLCFYCREPLSMSAATRDHVTPRSAPYEVRKKVRCWKRNIVLACMPCNNAKGNRLPTADEVSRARDTWAKIPTWGMRL